MAVGLGTGSVISMAVNGSTLTYASLGKVTGGSWSITNATADATNNDSGGYTEALYADQSGALEVSFKYDAADAAQTSLLTAAATKQEASTTYVTFRVRPIVGSGLEQWTFRALVTSVSISMQHGEVVTMDVSAISTGTITADTQ